MFQFDKVISALHGIEKIGPAELYRADSDRQLAIINVNYKEATGE